MNRFKVSTIYTCDNYAIPLHTHPHTHIPTQLIGKLLLTLSIVWLLGEYP